MFVDFEQWVEGVKCDGSKLITINVNNIIQVTNSDIKKKRFYYHENGRVDTEKTREVPTTLIEFSKGDRIERVYVLKDYETVTKIIRYWALYPHSKNWWEFT